MKYEIRVFSFPISAIEISEYLFLDIQHFSYKDISIVISILWISYDIGIM